MSVIRNSNSISKLDGFDVYMYTYIRIRKKKRRGIGRCCTVSTFMYGARVSLYTRLAYSNLVYRAALKLQCESMSTRPYSYYFPIETSPPRRDEDTSIQFHPINLTYGLSTVSFLFFFFLLFLSTRPNKREIRTKPWFRYFFHLIETARSKFQTLPPPI